MAKIIKFPNSPIRRLEVRTNAWKFGIYMARVGDNEMYAVCTSVKKMADLFGTVTCDKSKVAS